MIEVTPQKLIGHLKHDLKYPYPVYIWGAPGVGKSSIVLQVAKELGMEVVLLSVALEHPYTLGGLPVVMWRERSVAKLPPSYIKELRNAILFLDDFAASDPAQQRVALTLTTYRRVGDFTLHDSVRIIFASNRVEDSSFVIRPSMAVLNRVKHYILVPSLTDFFQFLMERCAPLDEISEFGDKIWDALFPYIVAYLRTRPDKFFTDVSKESDSIAYPTPRSWFHALCDLSLHAKEGNITIPLEKDDVASIVVSSWVGADAAKFFIPLLKVDMKEVDIYEKSPGKLKDLPPPKQIIFALLLLNRGVPPDKIVKLISPETAALISFVAKRAEYLSTKDKVTISMAAMRKEAKKP